MPKKKNPINKTLIKQIGDLSRLKLTTREEEKFVKELQKIVGYVEEIKEVDTSQVQPMTGGHSLKNAFRDDEINFSEKAQSTNESGLVIDSFPEEERGYLKVPKIL